MGSMGTKQDEGKLNMKRLTRVLALLLTLTMIAAACGSDDDGEAAPATTQPPPLPPRPHLKLRPAPHPMPHLKPVQLLRPPVPQRPGTLPIRTIRRWVANPPPKRKKNTTGCRKKLKTSYCLETTKRRSPCLSRRFNNVPRTRRTLSISS